MWKRPTVILIGPVNTGKSTLFNTFGEKRRAVTSSVPGTTRDMNVCPVFWNGREFSLLDSAGVNVEVEPVIDNLAKRFIERSLSKVDLVVFVFDGKKSRPADAADLVKKYSRKRQLPSLLVLNKIDSEIIAREIDPEWYKLGLPGPFLVSALKGRGTGDLLDEIVPRLPPNEITTDRTESIGRSEKPTVSVLILGQPNVGKSSLFNALIGQERSIVSSVPHTTRDWLDIILSWDTIRVRLIDTAGLRRKAKLRQGITAKRDNQLVVEQRTVQATLSVMKQSQVVLLVLDASKAITQQDLTLAYLVAKNNKPAVIVVNKWDLIANKTPRSPREHERLVRANIPFLSWAPILFVSSVKKQRVSDIRQAVATVYQNFCRTIPHTDLAQFLDARQNMRDMKRVVLIKQVASRPPSFVINHLYRRPPARATLDWLQNELHTHFSLVGTPLQLSTKSLQR